MLVYSESGENFINAVKRVKSMLKNDEDYLDLEFNELRIRVSKNSNIDDLCVIYDLKHTIRRMKSGYND